MSLPKDDKGRDRELRRLAKGFEALKAETKNAKDPLLKSLPRGPRPAPRWSLEDAKAEEAAWGHYGTRGQNQDRFN